MSTTTTAIGNLTREPELRFTNGGGAVCTFGIACSRRFQRNNEWQEETTFLNVVAWGQLGENAAQSLTKGARVVVTGRIAQRDYEAKDGGGKRTVFEIVADEIGAALRYATVQIERTARTDSTQQQQGSRAQAPSYIDDETEPF